MRIISDGSNKVVMVLLAMFLLKDNSYIRLWNDNFRKTIRYMVKCNDIIHYALTRDGHNTALYYSRYYLIGFVFYKIK